jgi:N-acetylglucosamine-6-phosphate deacetylase
MTLKFKSPDRVILVSDANALMGREQGDSVKFGGQQVTLTAQGSINEEGNLAGATCLLDGAIRNMVNWHILPFEQAIQLVTANPARYLGEAANLGQLAKNTLADVVLWDKADLSIKKVLVQGHVVFQAEAASV